MIVCVIERYPFHRVQCNDSKFDPLNIDLMTLRILTIDSKTPLSYQTIFKMMTTVFLQIVLFAAYTEGHADTVAQSGFLVF